MNQVSNATGMECNGEFDRLAITCVAAVQGGGVFGINLLGQLQAVYERQLVPAAFAGTSAGAIIAALCWSGYTPQRVREIFFDLAEHQKLADLLGGHENPQPPPLTALLHVKRRWPKRCWWLPAHLLWHSRVILKGWRRLSSQGGVYPGDRLESLMDDLLRSSPLLGPHVRDLPPGKSLTFGDVQALVENEYLEMNPLYLVATNLTQRRPEIVDSTDPRFADMTIARVVRASAGFPVALAPVRIPCGARSDWYTDGGVVLNFPAYVFSNHYRRADAGRLRLPYATVGLRVAPDPPEPGFSPTVASTTAAVTKLLTGEARNWLEGELANTCPYPIMITQPRKTTQAPEFVLDLDKLRGADVAKMFEASRQFARDKLDAYRFRLPRGDDAMPILRSLARLIEQAAAVLHVDDPHTDHDLRANVFLACLDKARNLKLVLKYAVNMDGDPDVDMVFDIGQGLTGRAFLDREPLWCDLRNVRKLMAEGHLGILETFKMTEDQQDKVREDRTFLMSVPIDEPSDVGSALAAFGQTPTQPTVHQTGADLTQWRGRTPFGVLNLDTSVPVSLDQEMLTDTLLQVMRLTSVQIGIYLAKAVKNLASHPDG